MKAKIEVSEELKDILSDEFCNKEFLVKAFDKAVRKYAVDIGLLHDWYITSVSQHDEPVWTDKHLKELMSDFYLIPRDISDRYKGSKK